MEVPVVKASLLGQRTRSAWDDIETFLNLFQSAGLSTSVTIMRGLALKRSVALTAQHTTESGFRSIVGMCIIVVVQQ